MFIQNPMPLIPLQHILFIVSRRRQLSEPLFSDVDLALGGAGVDVLETMGGRIDEIVVAQGFEEGLTGETDDIALLAVEIVGYELHDSIGDLCGGRGR